MTLDRAPGNSNKIKCSHDYHVFEARFLCSHHALSEGNTYVITLLSHTDPVMPVVYAHSPEKESSHMCYMWKYAYKRCRWSWYEFKWMCCMSEDDCVCKSGTNHESKSLLIWKKEIK